MGLLKLQLAMSLGVHRNDPAIQIKDEDTVPAAFQDPPVELTSSHQVRLDLAPCPQIRQHQESDPPPEKNAKASAAEPHQEERPAVFRILLRMGRKAC